MQHILGEFGGGGGVLRDAREAGCVALVPAPLEIAFVLVGVGGGGQGLELSDKSLPHG